MTYMESILGIVENSPRKMRRHRNTFKNSHQTLALAGSEFCR